MMFIKKWICILCIFLTSCNSSPSKPKRLNISFYAMPASTDPQQCGDFISATLICLIFDGLTRIGPGGKVEMALAERVDISRDGKRYLFTLRPTVWSDGTLVTASDFEKSWKRALHPQSASPTPYLFYPIKNAKEAYLGEADPQEIGIRALSDSLLEVELEQKTDYFLSLTAFPSFLPTPSHAQEKNRSLISNGPFLLASTEPNSSLLLKRNPRYWNLAPIRLEEIQIAILNNPSTAFRMYVKGELDCLGSAISPITPDCLNAAGFENLRIFPINATTFTTFQNSHPHLCNLNLRKALSFAINREEIVAEITQMGEAAATRIIPPSLAINKERTLFPSFDPVSALNHFQKALLELNIKKEDLQLTLSFSQSELNVRIAQAIQTKWKDVLDVDIALQAEETAAFKETLYRRKFDIALTSWIAQFLDPVNILERFEDSDNPKNYAGWSHPAYSQAIYAIRHKHNREAAIDQAEDLLADEVPIAPIFHWSNPILFHPSIQNLEVTPNGAILFERCYREEAPSTP